MKKDESGKWVPETDEEQQAYDYIFNKGYAQAKKSGTEKPKDDKPGEDHKTTNMFDAASIAEMIKATVSEAVKPLQQNFESMQSMSKQVMKDKVLSRQTTKLPDIYLSSVDGGTEADIKTSYDQAVEKFKADMKAIGVQANFGAETPPTDDKSSTDKPASKSFNDMTPQEKITLYKQDPETYSKLASGK